jgi:hypothetical protein
MVAPQADGDRHMPGVNKARQQRLTSNVGYPKLREHLGAVVAVLSMNYHDFLDKMDTDLRLGGSR